MRRRSMSGSRDSISVVAWIRTPGMSLVPVKRGPLGVSGSVSTRMPGPVTSRMPASMRAAISSMREAGGPMDR